LRYTALILSVIFLIIIYYKQTSLTLILFVFSIASFFLILFGVFLRVVENKSFLKELPLSKVTEGDWLAKDVIKNKKLICSKRKACLDKKQIEKLKKHKIRKIWIKEGIPFVPAILLGLILTIILFL
jgi:hypothetical protein